MHLAPLRHLCFVLGVVVAAVLLSTASASSDVEKRSSDNSNDAKSSHPSHQSQVHSRKIESEKKAPSKRESGTKRPRKTHSRKKRGSSYGSSALDPNDIDTDIKITWCNDNSYFCENVCQNMTWGAPLNSECKPSNLNWHCVCGNGKNPDPDYFTFPVMHYRCQYEVYQCQTNCPTGDIRCTQECQGDRNCTAPKDPNAGKTAVPEDDDPEYGLDSESGVGSDPVDFFNAASIMNASGYLAIAAIVITTLRI